MVDNNRRLDEVIPSFSFDTQRSPFQAAVSGPTPNITALSAIPQPMNSLQMMQTYFAPGGGGGIAGMMAQGLQSAQSLNVSNPYGTLGASVGMPPSYLMTNAQLGVFRPGPLPRAPALYSTPGMTGAFHSGADTASQYELMRTGMFADPNQAGPNYARMRVAQWGQDWGRWIGMAAGTVGGAAISGGAMTGMGATLGGAAGDFLGSHVGDIPVVGWAVRKAVELSNIGLTEQLSWMGGSQGATFGRTLMGGRDIGLGGRGMSAQASLNLGRQLRQMSSESGGQFNQVDMMNILRTAGETGFLDTATNADQVAKTVGNLMKIMGHLGKIMGDPDFRNNLREVGNLRSQGYTINQALQILPEMNRFSRIAGLPREQMMQQFGAPMAARAVSMGLTAGVGAAAGMFGAAEARLLSGSFTDAQKSLMGGEGGIAQGIGETQLAFADTVARPLALALLQSQGGKLGIDKDRLGKLMKSGKIDITQMAAVGAQNVHEVARQQAESTARAEGRPVTSEDVSGALLRISNRLKEFQSDIFHQVGPRGTQLLMFNTMEHLKNTHGAYKAAAIMAGGDPNRTEQLYAMMTDPTYRERVEGQAIEEERRIRGEATLSARGRAAAREEEWGTWGITKSLRKFSAWLQKPTPLSEGALREADEVTRQIQRESFAMQGIVGVPVAGVMAGLSSHIVERVKKSTAASRMTGEDFRAGVPITREEIQAYHRREGFGTPSYNMMDPKELQRYHELNVLGDPKAQGDWINAARSDLISRVDTSMKRARASGADLEKANQLTEMEFRRGSKQLYDALGTEFKGESSAAMVAVKNHLRNWAAGKGRDSRGVDSTEMRGEIAKALQAHGMSPERARQFVSQNQEFFGTWGMKVLTTFENEDVKKALVATSDEAVLLQGLGITERGEAGLQQAEKKLIGALTSVGALKERVVRSGSGMGIARLSPELTQEQRDAFAMIQGVGKEGGMSVEDESRQRALMVLVARSQGGEGVSEEESLQAQKTLESLEAGADEATLSLLSKAREAVAGKGAGVRGGLSGLGRLYEGVEWGKGGTTAGAKGILEKFVSSDIAAQELRGGKASAIYAGAHVRAAAEKAGAVSGTPKEAKEEEVANDAKELVKIQKQAFENFMIGTDRLNEVTKNLATIHS